MKLKGEFEVVSVGDEVMAVPVGDGAENSHFVVRLNDSAAEIFELLKTETTEAEIVAALAAKYENDKGELAGYVRETVQMFSDNGILTADA